mgnify:CR=1 FL=1
MRVRIGSALSLLLLAPQDFGFLLLTQNNAHLRLPNYVKNSADLLKCLKNANLRVSCAGAGLNMPRPPHICEESRTFSTLGNTGIRLDTLGYAGIHWLPTQISVVLRVG